MKSAQFYFIELIRVVLPVAILAAGVFAFAAISGQREPPPQVEREVSLPVVETVAVEPHEGSLDVHVDGTVVPFREVTLSAEVGGRITSKSPECRAGRYVTRGTLLVEIDPRSYLLDVQRLQEEVNQAEANIQELGVEIENTESLIALAREEAALRKHELTRTQSLFQQNATSESSLDEAKRFELSARNSLAMLTNQARVLKARRIRLTSARELAQTQLERAQLDLEKSQVRAPIDGVIVSEEIEEDSFVQPGTALLSIDDTSAVEVRCSLRMEELEWVLLHGNGEDTEPVRGDPTEDYHLPLVPVTVSYRLGQREFQWEGRLSRYEGIGLDEKTRTIPVRVLIPEPRQVRSQALSSFAGSRGPKALVRGMYVDVAIHTDPQVQLLRVPDEAIQPGNVVWSVRSDKLQRVFLRNVVSDDEILLVASSPNGLMPGDHLVVTPLSAPTEGMSVQQQESSVLAEGESL